MTATGIPRCCAACGRWGNRGYIPAPQGREEWVCSNDRACAARARGPVSEAGTRALDAARQLTAAGHREFSRTCLMRQALGPISTPGARMAFSRTVSALIRTGHLAARVQDDTLNELVGVGPDLGDQLRAGDLDALASRIGGQIAVLSLPRAETARVSAPRYHHDPVVAAEDTHPSGIHTDQTSKPDTEVA